LCFKIVGPRKIKLKQRPSAPLEKIETVINNSKFKFERGPTMLEDNIFRENIPGRWSQHTGEKDKSDYRDGENETGHDDVEHPE